MNNVTPEQLAYLAGLIDGEGTFVCTTRTNSFGVQVSSTTPCLIQWCHHHFGGFVSHGARRSPRHRDVEKWTCGRRQELRDLCVALLPYLVLKRGSALAMIDLLDHRAAAPRWDTRPTSTLSPRGKGGAERQKRRDIRAAWKVRELELREAVRAARLASLDAPYAPAWR